MNLSKSFIQTFTCSLCLYHLSSSDYSQPKTM